MKVRTFLEGIDSLTIQIPFSVFDAVPYYFEDNILEVSETTGEILAQKSGKPVFDVTDGVTLRAVSVYSLYFKERCVSLTLNTKMLQHEIVTPKGLDSMHEGNFPKIFQYVLDITGLEIEYDSFLHNSCVYDVDFKADFLLDDTMYQVLMNDYRGLRGAKIYYNKVASKLEKKTFSGMTFVNRNDASVSKPFVKLYSKLEELQQRSSEFYDAFMPLWNLPDYRRMECTLANSKHFAKMVKLGLLPVSFEKEISLWKILTISRERCRMICFEYLGMHLFPESVKLKGNEEMAVSKDPKYTMLMPNTYMLGAMCYSLMEEGYSFMNVVNLFDLKRGSDKTQAVRKNRLKNRLTEALRGYCKIQKVNNIKLEPKDAFFIH